MSADVVLGLTRTCFKHILWQLVWDMGGEITIPGDAIYGPWPEKGRMIRVRKWEGCLIIMAEGTDEDYAELKPRVEEFTIDDSTNSPGTGETTAPRNL